MSFCDWIYEYMKGLQKFGVSDDTIKNGFISLCNSYKRKVHLQLYPLVTNALIRDKNSEPIEITKRGQAKLYTNGPKDVFKIFNEVLEIIQSKKVKELTLRVLEVIHQILVQYQQATLMMIRADSTLDNDFLIAQSNNCGTLFDLIQHVVEPITKLQICTEDELKKAFDERIIEQNSYKVIQEIMRKVSDWAYLQTQNYFVVDFLDMDLDSILHKNMGIYEDLTDKMDISSSREAWK
jgi:predicted house-cleaning noncanonical NTP pyrophosphatase (MazG superfamily)